MTRNISRLTRYKPFGNYERKPVLCYGACNLLSFCNPGSLDATLLASGWVYDLFRDMNVDCGAAQCRLIGVYTI